MKKTAKRFLSMLLALTLLLGLAVPAMAVPAEEKVVVTVKEPAATTGDAKEDTDYAAVESEDRTVLTGEVIFNSQTLQVGPAVGYESEDVDVDHDDPIIIAVEKELDEMKVLNEDGEQVGLTDVEKQTVLAEYQKYLDYWTANANVLGVQLPFFIQYNDDVDELGILGEMLALANVPVDAVRAGQFSYNDLLGMIWNFQFGDSLGVEFYGDAIAAARDEILALVEASGAQTDAQKLLIVNDWLAHNNTFDMPYIMNNGKEEDEKPMVAEDPVKHERYDQVYGAIYAVYEPEMMRQFHDPIYEEVVAGLRQSFYEAAIRQIIWDNTKDQYLTQVGATEDFISAGVAAFHAEKKAEAQAAEEKRVYDVVYDAAYNQYLDDNCTHTYVEGVCSNCGRHEDGSISAETQTGLQRIAAVTAQVEAEEAVAAAAADTDAVATAAAEEAVAALTDDEKAAMGKEQASANADVVAAAEAEADTQADAFMQEHADAITEDAPAFVEREFGPEAAAALAQQANDFIANAETNGVEVAPGVYMTVEELTQDTMENEECINLGTEEEPYMVTPNVAARTYADQAALGLTDGVLNYWEGTQFGALGAGRSVCLGYAKAFAYLVQCMYPEIYGVNGANTDMSVSSNWKSRNDLYFNDEGVLDINEDYIVDMVRISFDASVTMYGETQDNFNSDHFWNAVKLDGQWYYVDPCYTDVFTEVMIRDRVETDGSMNHLYFLFSHDSCEELYDGYYSEIKTLYADAADDKSYEDSWISRIKSNVYYDGSYYYYFYDSTDLITLMSESTTSSDVDDSTYKLVRHKISTNDTGDGDSDYDTLIFFNYVASEDADPVAQVRNQRGQLVTNDLLTELYARHEAACEAYPSLAITAALYEGKLYFNLANCLLSYDLSSCEVVLVKEYNVVYGVRDDTMAFGGMAFSVVDSAAKADFTVKDHPIAGITIKGDELYVSIATNFAFISGKDPHNSSDNSSYGYEFEESNYNSKYSAYNDYGGYDDTMLESFGYEREINDNDEFMWSANFVEISDMTHLVGEEHDYASVTVDPSCGIDGYTENRCTDCGRIEDGSRVVDEGSALDHHYIHFDETYYTKDSNGNWNTGDCYVCTVCLSSVSEPTEPKQNDNYGSFGTSYEEQMAQYEKDKAIYDEVVAHAGHTYVPTDASWTSDGTTVQFSKLACSNVCVERKALLDCLVSDSKVSVTLPSGRISVAASVTDYEGDCATGLVATYSVNGVADGYAYTASTQVDIEPGKHAYSCGEEGFTWADDNSSATVDLTCGVCGDHHEDVVATVTYDSKNSTAATCTAAGKDIYVATAIVTDEDGNEIGSATETKEITLDILPHSYSNGKCSVCGQVQLTVPTIVSCYSKLQNTVKVTWKLSEGATGYQIWRTTTPEDEDSWAIAKTIKDGSTDRYTNQGLEVGVTYYYRVRAYVTDAEGKMSFSDFSNMHYMPAAVLFDNPYSNATYRIRLRWEEVGGSHGYQIWRQNADGSFSIAKTIGDRGSELTNDQGSTTAYSNTGLTAGNTYTYKMRAFMITEDGRKIFGAYSDVITVAVKPEAPAVIGASNKAERAQISWTALNGATGYQVWMSTSADGTYKIAKSITDGATTSATIYGLTSGQTYYFKVRAYVEVNGKMTFGGYSEVITVKAK